MLEYIKKHKEIFIVILLSSIVYVGACYLAGAVRSKVDCFDVHNNSNHPLEIGDRLVIEDIDKDGVIHIVPEDQSNEVDAVPQLIWNDDHESIPTPGSDVVIEMIRGNKVYVGPKN